ncbi:MAG: sulfatase-like hydrolase/transferase, partial [Verrucomicrobiia bacterium]
AVCSSSRAALLSGTVPGRNQVFGAHGPFGRGLTPDIKILPELLKPRGYATGHFGKWHIGDQPETRPLARGFDEHAGLMYSNDMWRFHPGNPEHWGKHPLQFWDNGEVTIEDMDKPDQTLLTVWATENSVDFINRHHDEPFFLYLAHSMPHVPLFVSDRFAGKSGMGLYGDVMMELDWSVGEVMKALEAHHIADDTIVIFTSDNGPWHSYGNHAGATPFREAKATGFDGGLRSATVVRYPPAVPAGHRSTTMFGTIDLMPTLARLAGADLPDHEIDGRDIWPILTSQPLATNPHRYYPFSTSKEFEGIISGDGRWKLHLPHSYRHLIKAGNEGVDGTFKKWEIGLSLFDLKADPNELINLIDEEPEIAAELISWAKNHRDRFYSKSKK